MKPATTEDIFELLDGNIISSALGTALELGLFWRLAENPLAVRDVAQALDIPLNRCHLWLQILCQIGLLEERAEGYIPSALTRETIMNAHSQATWAFLARESRDRFLAVRDLAVNICQPISTWETQNVPPPDYFKQILENPVYAAQFTYMLYEIHIPLAEQLAKLLDLRGVKKLMDLGGGSGVVSFALLRKYPELNSVVIDVENVCQAGRELAAENNLETRISYLAVDFLQEDLPGGFDVVIFCDSGPLTESMFRKIHAALNPNGRIVIVGQFPPNKNHPAPSHLSWAFLAALEYPAQSIAFTTTAMLQAQLQQAGFRDFTTASIPHEEDLRWNLDWMALEARK